MDASRHLPLETLAAGLRTLTPPKDTGTVALIVARPKTDERNVLSAGELTQEDGLVGDKWGAKGRPHPDSQITLMRVDVARLIANGQPIELAGDQLFVELDLSMENLPSGTRLRIGDALCEVTPVPHTGCGKFAARFGADARAVTNHPEFLDQRLRGIYVKVIEPGTVRTGDEIHVLSRPS
jgi:MOSC domain-containing protein YiiM